MTGTWVCDECGAEATAVYDDPKLGEEGPFDVVCTECAWTAYMPAASTARTRIGALRQIVRDHKAARIDGYLVDAFTASMLVAVYEALSKESREKFGKPPLLALVDFGWQHVKK